MKSKLKLISIFSLIILITGTVFLVYSINNKNENLKISEMSQDNFVVSLANCSSNTWTAPVIVSPEVLKCQTDLTTAYLKNNKVNEALNGLSLLANQNPDFWIPCHDMLHKAGGNSVESIESGVNILMQINIGACQAGAVHGILDGVALHNPTLLDFEKLSDVCIRYKTDTNAIDGDRLFNYCADGLGHAAWSASKNLNKAVAYCEVLKDPWMKVLCAEGIMMQIFEPANDVPAYPKEESGEVIPEMCSNWPAGTGSKTYLGCNRGAAYVYTRDAWKIDSSVVSNKNYIEIEELQNYTKKAQDSLISAISLCKTSHKGTGRDYCLEGVSWQIPDLIVNDANSLKEVCGQLEKHETTCLTMHANRYDEQDGYFTS